MLITKFETKIILSLIVFSSIIIFFTILQLNKFNLYYLSFSLISTILVVNSIKNNNYGNIFINTFFYLGFFFKISIIIIISNNLGTNIYFEESYLFLNVNSNFFKIIFIKLSIFFLLLIFFENLLIGKNKIKTIYKNNFHEHFIKKKKKIVFIFVLFLIIFFNYLNYRFEIIQRGSLSFSTTYTNIFKIINYFGQSALICLIIDIEKKLDSKKIIFIYLLIFSSILNHLTILSRSGIFEILAILYIFTKDNPKQGLFLIFLSLLIWILSFNLANDLRLIKVNNYNDEKANNKNLQSIKVDKFDELNKKNLKTEKNSIKVNNTNCLETKNCKTDKKLNIDQKIISDPQSDELILENSEEMLNKQNNYIDKIRSNKFTYLLVYRWTGIDGFINTEIKDDKNIGNLLGSFYEIKRNLNGTYYERTFFKVPNKQIYNQTFIPGYLAFANFGNNYTFFFGAFLLIMIILIFNKILNIFMRDFEYFKCFIFFIVAWRLAHFGILPLNTLIYFLTIIVFIIVVSSGIKIFDKIYS